MSQVIKNRYEFIVLVEGKMCNPNGDPDMGNLPRQDSETGCGYITDVAFKRRIRNYVDDGYGAKAGMEILMRSGTSINRKIAESVMKVNDLKKVPAKFANPKVSETAQDMMKRYWDVRTFGAVLSTGLNAGQVRGAVQIGMATSVDPIELEDITITRMVYADGKDFTTIEEYENEEKNRADDKKRTMGSKKFTPYGLYVMKGTISASLAEKTGFSEADRDLLFEAILQMYNHDISSSKQGMSVVSPLIIFKHVGTQDPANADQNAREAKLGCASAHRLFALLEVNKKDEVDYARDITDYEVALKLSEVPAGIDVGIKEEPFSNVVYGDKVPETAKRNGILIK